MGSGQDPILKKQEKKQSDSVFRSSIISSENLQDIRRKYTMQGPEEAGRKVQVSPQTAVKQKVAEEIPVISDVRAPLLSQEMEESVEEVSDVSEISGPLLSRDAEEIHAAVGLMFPSNAVKRQRRLKQLEANREQQQALKNRIESLHPAEEKQSGEEEAVKMLYEPERLEERDGREDAAEIKEELEKAGKIEMTEGKEQVGG